MDRLGATEFCVDRVRALILPSAILAAGLLSLGSAVRGRRQLSRAARISHRQGRNARNSVQGSRVNSAISPAAPFRLDPPLSGRILQDYGRLPLSFEANVGQVGGQAEPKADSPVKFLARGAGYTLFLDRQ